MDRDLAVDWRQRGSASIVDLKGDLTVNAQEALDQAYLAIVQANAPLVIFNLAGVDYATSNGLSLMAHLLVRMRHENRRAGMVGLNPHLRKLCRMMGLAGYAEMYADEEEALNRLSSP